MKFSVLMSVYVNERVEYFISAMNSVINQTIKPDEILLVRDGLVYEELQQTIDKYLETYPDLFTYIPLEENGGLGNALKLGVEKARNELIARMDTDDICFKDRFEKQLKIFYDNPNVDMVGGYVAEFIDDTQNVLSYRQVPLSHTEIIKRMGKQNPFNHQTVMFKKSAVLKAGNYEHFYLFEDWYLWVKMLLSGCEFYNIGEPLCYFRVSGMAKRRGGVKYFKSCKKLLKFMKNNKVIGIGRYLKSLVVRFTGYVLCPNFVRAWAYKKFLRKKRI